MVSVLWPRMTSRRWKSNRCHGELYFILDANCYLRDAYEPLHYDAYSNCWKSIPYVREQRLIRKAFVRNEDEIYVLSVSKLNGRNCPREFEYCVEVGHVEHVYSIKKYKPESHLRVY